MANFIQGFKRNGRRAIFNKIFMFGNQGKSTAEESYKFPIKIGVKLHVIVIDVITCVIPLLL